MNLQAVAEILEHEGYCTIVDKSVLVFLEKRDVTVNEIEDALDDDIAEMFSFEEKGGLVEIK